MKKLHTIKVGTRGSSLALKQAQWVSEQLSLNNPSLDFEIVPIKTTGDKILDSPLSKIGDKGLFTREIEEALLSGAIDLAVHSLKDMPTQLPSGLALSAVPERLDPRDVFISKGLSFEELGPGRTIATSSLRRRAQLLAQFPGLSCVDIRGNVNTRIKKMRKDTGLDGIILAKAGVERLGLSAEIESVIPEERILPAVGQGALGIEIRAEDSNIRSIVALINDPHSEQEVLCEREFLFALGGGCQVPIAGRAKISADEITLEGMVCSLDGKTVYREKISSSITDSLRLGRNLAEKILNAGGRMILEEIYGRPLS